MNVNTKNIMLVASFISFHLLNKPINNMNPNYELTGLGTQKLRIKLKLLQTSYKNMQKRLAKTKQQNAKLKLKLKHRRRKRKANNQPVFNR